MKYYLKAINNYANFNGRATRSEYWYFFLFNVLISIGFRLIGVAIQFPLLGSIYSLALLVPGIAVAIRRMHDVSKSGWYILIPIYNIVLACTESTPGDNEYGPDPNADMPDFDFENNPPL